MFTLKPICVYAVHGDDGHMTCGMLYTADITAFGELPTLEIAERCITADLPESWTYPLIQPLLLDEALRRGAV